MRLRRDRPRFDRMTAIHTDRSIVGARGRLRIVAAFAALVLAGVGGLAVAAIVASAPPAGVAPATFLAPTTQPAAAADTLRAPTDLARSQGGH
jgi:hypothetical protein